MKSLYGVGALAVVALISSLDVVSAAERPNIIVILADDAGYGDLGCYGATRVKTPNLDKLASQGTRFTDAYAPSAMCTPTRYALMTGQYAWRHPPGSRVLSGVAPLCIPAGTVTVPSLLRQAGYTTGCVGKWHLGLGTGQTEYNGEIKPGPREVGFDYSFIIPATGDRVPCVYVEDQRVVGNDPKDPVRVSYTTPIGDEPTGANHPELLKLKASEGHDGTIVNGVGRIGYMAGGKVARWKDEDMADDLTRKAIAFITKNKDRPFFLYFATHDIHVPRLPHLRFAGTSQCGVRGDVIHQLDGSVGEVLAALDRLELASNTLVIFSSDNGGVMDDGYADGCVADAHGHKCNGPLRGFKGGLYEGGTREPFIARWPGKVPAGKTSGAILCLVDLLATVAAIAGKDLAPEAGPDSFNQLPALLGEKREHPCRDHVIIHNGYGGLAIRKGPWKLIGEPGKTRTKGAPVLYNLADDLGEIKDIAATHPDKVKELTALLAQLRADGHSRPAGR
jgi:arylsulfatase A-like enzyme